LMIWGLGWSQTANWTYETTYYDPIATPLEVLNEGLDHQLTVQRAVEVVF